MNGIVVEISPQVELMNSILLTSNHGNIINDLLGFNPMINIETEYIQAIKEFFSQYREYEVYSIIEKMTKNGFYLGRPVELMCSVDGHHCLILNIKYPNYV